MMRIEHLFFVVVVSITLGACATGKPMPPKSYQVAMHPLLQNKGILLVVDPCIQRREVKSIDEYFPIQESKEIGGSIAEAVRKFAEVNHINIKSVILPFVCGARNEPKNSAMMTSERVGEKCIEAEQPLAVNDEIDTDLSNALSIAATYSFRKAFHEYYEIVSKTSPTIDRKKEFPTFYDTTIKSLLSTEVRSITLEELKTAAELILNRTGMSLMIYVGIRGVSRSTGVAVGENVIKAIFGTASAYTTVVTAGALQYRGWVIPGIASADGSLIGAALLNLETERSEWTDGIFLRGDPLEPGAINKQSTIEALFRSAIYFPVRQNP